MLKRTVKNTLLAMSVSSVIGITSGLAATVLVLGVHKIIKKIKNK